MDGGRNIGVRLPQIYEQIRLHSYDLPLAMRGVIQDNLLPQGLIRIDNDEVQITDKGRHRCQQMRHAYELECAKGFLDQKGIDRYQFGGEHEYYQHTLERIYGPLVRNGLLIENENNNFTIPPESRLHEICRRELTGKAFIEWDDFSSQYLKV